MFTSWLRTAASVIFPVGGLCLAFAGWAADRDEQPMSPAEMLASFGGAGPFSNSTCAFNPTCYFANTYTQSCQSLPNDVCQNGPQVTDYTQNQKQYCTSDGGMGGFCTENTTASDQLCSTCENCETYVDPLDQQTKCRIVPGAFGLCGTAYNWSSCSSF